MWEAPELRVAIGHALLTASRPLTAKELEDPTRTHQSNVLREAERMAELRLINRVPDPPRRTRRGAPPRVAFELDPAQRATAKRELKGRPPSPARRHSTHVGRLKRGQEIVIADATAPSLAGLFGALRNVETSDSAGWAALVGDELAVAFDGEDPAGPALQLVAALAAAGIPARRATVARVRALPDFLP
jgi:hypothetical protein